MKKSIVMITNAEAHPLTNKLFIESINSLNVFTFKK